MHNGAPKLLEEDGVSICRVEIWMLEVPVWKIPRRSRMNLAIRLEVILVKAVLEMNVG